MSILCIPLDLEKQFYLFDGMEPDDYYAKIPIPQKPLDWSFSLGEIYGNPFEKLVDFLGQEAFQQIIDSQGIIIPQNEWERFKGSSGLRLYFYFRNSELPDYQLLILISSGEFQPARYMAHLEGIWKVQKR
jgi:hypothetical protein